MQIVTLLANPDRANLSRTGVDTLRRAWGGGEVRWLDPGIAVEFPLESVPSDFRARWQELQDQGFDLNILPAEGRRKKVLLADMDSTMIGQECVDELAAEAGVGPRVAEITARAMNGELDFEGALRERVALLAGLPAEVIHKVLAERITFTPGGRKLIGTMKTQGGYTVLVSGGFTAFSEAVATYLGFDENRANVLLVEDGKLSGKVAEPILGRAAKVAALEATCARLGVAEDQVIAVGDGANDLDMLHRAGCGVALHAKPTVAAQCEVRVNHGDLTALLYLQGYGRDEIVAAP
ncbi:phosphoserine phosphatase [Defluviimonas sp. 20V17]|uniref:Phosphoserine phosphatase n=1 Tax=Allgaiera indica TaxID=765699 RepID=A0AAN4UNF1_9RHOB|nr:phosphoserine phosphatase SerB [Allgaiera indica]KDB05688.1 phosphoserine phosphatase [Defluviimonas sp. 20V17]GHD98934.1 phosphoserine phosphatase SerB [Allgaiera indica]SDW03186.1 phosphoserine phosphatase [Allgaiera indica]